LDLAGTNHGRDSVSQLAAVLKINCTLESLCMGYFMTVNDDNGHFCCFDSNDEVFCIFASSLPDMKGLKVLDLSCGYYGSTNANTAAMTLLEGATGNFHLISVKVDSEFEKKHTAEYKELCALLQRNQELPK
jgi:hypothetical protein